MYYVVIGFGGYQMDWEFVELHSALQSEPD